MLDTSEVERLFAVWKDDGQEKKETLKVSAENIMIRINIFLKNNSF